MWLTCRAGITRAVEDKMQSAAALNSTSGSLSHRRSLRDSDGGSGPGSYRLARPSEDRRQRLSRTRRNSLHGTLERKPSARRSTPSATEEADIQFNFGDDSNHADDSRDDGSLTVFAVDSVKTAPEPTEVSVSVEDEGSARWEAVASSESQISALAGEEEVVCRVPSPTREEETEDGSRVSLSPDFPFAHTRASATKLPAAGRRVTHDLGQTAHAPPPPMRHMSLVTLRRNSSATIVMAQLAARTSAMRLAPDRGTEV